MDEHGLEDTNSYFTLFIRTNNNDNSRILDKDLGSGFFFLSLRGTSGERIEERGILNKQEFQTRLLSPALSSIGWRRGSGCGL